MSPEEAAHFPANIFTRGPLRPKLPEYEGSTDFACPACRVVLAERTNAWGVSQIPRIDCYACHLSWRGTDLTATS